MSHSILSQTGLPASTADESFESDTISDLHYYSNHQCAALPSMHSRHTARGLNRLHSQLHRGGITTGRWLPC